MNHTHAIAAIIAAHTPLIPCRACGQSGHAITACPQIAHFDMESHLREQLANAHEAIGCALALVRQGSANAAEIVLEDAMKGTRP